MQSVSQEKIRVKMWEAGKLHVEATGTMQQT